VKRLCEDCGADISFRGRAAKRCVPCSKKHANIIRELSRKPKPKVIQPPVPKPPAETKSSSRCKSCFYVHRNGFCDYFDLTGRTRTSQHMDDLAHLNSPCKEYRPQKGGEVIVDGSP